MAEAETDKESVAKPSLFIRSIIERAEKKLKDAKQYPDIDKEDKKNVEKNGRHFLHCLEKIPAGQKANINTPQELIAALNEITHAEGKLSFFSPGEIIKAKSKQSPWKIVGIFLNVDEIWNQLGEEAFERELIHMSGTNLWDNPPPIGSRLIPCTYHLEEIKT